ncbi:hypothetical protein M9Y10_008594 [Tritrichomonas musculus]|uniref:Uncharacterized protein n=1 Tax=Tritrichomonas musculus TaxID=1915356 RepID=A0ABR2IZB0_9EUKA
MRFQRRINLDLSICCKSSAVQPKFRKWLLSGNERGEPLSIIALRRFMKNPSDENKKDLAYAADPFYGRIEFADLFIKFIEDQVAKKGDAFTFNKSLRDGDKVMYHLDFRSIFKIFYLLKEAKYCTDHFLPLGIHKSKISAHYSANQRIFFLH